ncbi:electron transport complex subunit RsxE [Acidaminobacter sp.]|jgi:Na+-translocating ferredoxin:NAD+ oxidoreductase subunit E|uniref:electron transport complex subunit RsxE n=1 Tax=Acidaminobacter sp. TaxID=1872102 RepID=UPI00137FE9AE|nr:electron transport complex subunit E [Acidaminobacter sp.]MDK9709796.1 electron transport complex subunit E [Acidaminobacter sp.]MZQ96848.1 RnfABCDGE type electron transport complex subunit E [Acidaminobacter sp.]
MNLKHLTNGLIKENPTFYQLLGMCPTLAVTTSAQNGLGMGLATTAVLVGSNAMISILRKIIPNKIRIPAFVVVIAAFVTIVGMVMEGFVPALYKSLGLFIPLIVVNCIILARAESFAFKNGVGPSVLDGVGMGLGFTWALVLLGMIRELLGTGMIFGISVLGAAYKPAIIMILPPGGFLTLGLVLAVYSVIKSKKAAAGQ